MAEANTQDLESMLRDLALACRILGGEGHDDMMLGHLSLRDPEGRGFWMKRSGIALSEIRTPADFLLLDFDGNKLAGDGSSHSEWPIHGELLQMRGDVQVVGHSHAFYAACFSAVTDEFRPVAHEGAYFHNKIGHYRGSSELIRTRARGREVAESVGDAYVGLMRNHGCVFCGPSIPYAALMGVFLEKACRAQFVLEGSGLAWETPDADEISRKAPSLLGPDQLTGFWNYFKRKIGEAG